MLDVVLENVGGAQLVAAWGLLRAGGRLQSIGWASGGPAVFPPYSTIGPPRSLTSFLNQPPFTEDLATLVQLAADGALTPQVGWRGPWERLTEAMEALRARRLDGKAILDLV